jgi:hypothetical protein
MLSIPEDFLNFGIGFVDICKPMEQQARAAIFVCRDALITQKLVVIRVNGGRRRDPDRWSWVPQELLNVRANFVACSLDLQTNYLIRQWGNWCDFP